MLKLLAVIVLLLVVLTACTFLHGLDVGENIEFGEYSWIVLDIQGRSALIITENVIDMRPFSVADDATTWENSSIRNWLNTDFYYSFDLADRNRIIESEIVNSDNNWFESYAGRDTVDNIFLLSIDEALLYFGGGKRGDVYNEYVGLVGIWGERDNERIAYDADGQARWWRLRSPGQHDNFTANVSVDGSVNIQGTKNYGQVVWVRPVMRIRIVP
ncbi:MAG: DUF6273 domain-containing protein [Oscillospiraceae bacterium]|nr:DUF6273 domain-containing protein [Oscillospiraceae bacterium]